MTHLPVTPLRITSRYGPRNTGIPGASTFHKGIDLGADRSKKETSVHSVDDGVVVQNYWNDYRGWTVVVQHHEFSTLYQHLKEKSPLKVGQEIASGTVVGIMGNSSNPAKLKTATHLHFEVHINGEPVNPEPFLKNIKEYEMITKTKIEINGKIKEVDRILKNDENFVRLRDLSDVLHVEYDSQRKLPIVRRK